MFVSSDRLSARRARRGILAAVAASVALVSLPTVETAQSLQSAQPPQSAQSSQSARPAQPQEAVTLRLDARTGEVLTYRYEQQMDFYMPPEFGGDQAVRSHLVLAQTAQRVAPDTIHYESEVKDIAVDMNGHGAAGLDFSQFQGQRFRSAVTRRGEVLSLEMQEAVAGSEQIEMSLRQVGFPVLPGHPVRVGDSWSDTTRVDAAAMAVPAEGEIVSVNRATLRGISREGSARVADLRVETTFTFEPGRQPFPGMRVEMTGTRSDDVRFDITNGRFLSGSGQQQFVLQMAMPGATGSLAIQGTARSRATLVP